MVKNIMTKYAYADAIMVPECLSNLMIECWHLKNSYVRLSAVDADAIQRYDSISKKVP